MPTFVAVDLGATSGRVVNVHIAADHIDLDVIRRFPTATVTRVNRGLVWDLPALLANVRAGLTGASARARVESVAIDSWAIDYGLLDSGGRVLGDVHAYRSSRTDGVMEAVCAQLGRDRIYRTTGIQFLPFNTIYQLVAARETPEYQQATRMLMLPDLINHELCGSITNDVTNASTTQLLDVEGREWSDGLIAAAGLRREIFPELHQPGSRLGMVDGVEGMSGIALVAAASHDTASAVAGTPLRSDRPAIYISCGTWALVGCELRAPVTTDAALAANVTNELGVAGSVRLLKNVTGMWLLEECRRQWADQGIVTDAAELVAAAEHLPAGQSVIDPDDSSFATAGDMADRIAAACRATGQPVPTTPAEITRTILESLALKWRATVRTIERIAGFEAEAIHLVGGGSAIALLGQLCASACARPVLPGPAEATVIGNALVQAVAAGALDSIEHGRRLVDSMAGTVIDPRRTVDWDALADRIER